MLNCFGSEHAVLGYSSGVPIWKQFISFLGYCPTLDICGMITSKGLFPLPAWTSRAWTEGWMGPRGPGGVLAFHCKPASRLGGYCSTLAYL